MNHLLHDFYMDWYQRFNQEFPVLAISVIWTEHFYKSAPKDVVLFSLSELDQVISEYQYLIVMQFNVCWMDANDDKIKAHKPCVTYTL